MILLDISLMPLANIRQAVFHYSKETKDSTGSVSAKKHAHFTQILAIQLAAEQQRRLPSGEMKSKLQSDLARRLMKQAYEAASDDPIAFKDIRDLRFMGEIFARQGKCNELLEHWDQPPAALQDLMTRHQGDLWDMRIRLPKNSGEWSLLESQCLAYIERVISHQERYVIVEERLQLTTAATDLCHSSRQSLT